MATVNRARPNHHHPSRLIPFIRGVPLVAVLLLAPACASDEKSSSTTAASGNDLAIGGGEAPIAPAETYAPADTAAPADMATADTTAAAAAPGDDTDAAQRLGLDAAPRQLVIDATVGVDVADVGEAVSKLVDLAAVHRGQVYDSDVNLSDEANARGTLVIKLPPDEVEATIADLRTIGNVVTRTQNTDDVTDQLTDLGARISTAQQSVDAVRLLMAGTKDLNQIVLLENELNTRQTVLEQLLAQQKGIKDRVALATLTVELHKAAPVVAEPIAAPPAKPHDTGVGEAFHKGWTAFIDFGRGTLVAIGYVAPFLVIGLLAMIPLAIRRRASRRRNRSAAQPLQPAPAAGP